MYNYLNWSVNHLDVVKWFYSEDLLSFETTSTKFNEKYLVEVFVNLVKAVKISQIDNSISFDHGPNNKLFYTPAFDHLI